MKKIIKETLNGFVSTILELYDKGINPFQMPVSKEHGKMGLHLRDTGGPLGRMNQVFASIGTARLLAYTEHNSISQYWFTKKQAFDLGGRLLDKAGLPLNESDVPSVKFFKPIIIEKHESELSEMQLKHAVDSNFSYITFNKEKDLYEIHAGWSVYDAYNAVQFTGLPKRFQPASQTNNPDSDKLNSLSTIIGDHGIQIYTDKTIRKGALGVYNNRDNDIKLHSVDMMGSYQMYSSVLAHEFTHATGHLNLFNRFKSESSMEEHAYEEVLAEVGSGMLMSAIGFQSIPIIEQYQYIAKYSLLSDNNDDLDIAKVFMNAANQCGNIIRTINNNDPLLIKAFNSSPEIIKSCLFTCRRNTNDPYEAKKMFLKMMGHECSLAEAMPHRKKALIHLLKHQDKTLPWYKESFGGKGNDSFEELIKLAKDKLSEGITFVKENGLCEELSASLEQDAKIYRLNSDNSVKSVYIPSKIANSANASMQPDNESELEMG